MRTDGKTMGFVANILHIKRNRRSKRQGKTFAPQNMIKFFTGVALRSFGNGNNRNAAQVVTGKGFMHRVQLSQTAVKQNHIRFIFRAHPLKTPQQNFLHHCKIVIGICGIFYVKRAIRFFIKPLRSCHNHRPHRV